MNCGETNIAKAVPASLEGKSSGKISQKVHKFCFPSHQVFWFIAGDLLCVTLWLLLHTWKCLRGQTGDWKTKAINQSETFIWKVLTSFPLCQFVLLYVLRRGKAIVGEQIKRWCLRWEGLWNSHNSIWTALELISDKSFFFASVAWLKEVSFTLIGTKNSIFTLRRPKDGSTVYNLFHLTFFPAT